MTVHLHHLHIVRPSAVRLVTDERHATVETPDHEVIDFEGCSTDELAAKLYDFRAWAS